MIDRRQLILGGSGLAAAALAYALKPHSTFNLLGRRKIADIVPKAFGPWSAQEDGSNTPETEGALAQRLYNEIVSRIYTHANTGDEVMVLIAYGATQSEFLQLHRPETCYPAVGYHVATNLPAQVRVGPHATIPARRMLAEVPNREERIVYWTRVGEFLPTTGAGQREAQLRSAMQGYVPDGVLCRFSSIRADDAVYDMLDSFIAGLVAGVAPLNRAALLGTKIAQQTTA